jgi:hypothetical protein
MSDRLRNNVIAGFIVVILAGCSVFPSTTQISANSKLDKIDNPNLKVQQNFRWYRN